MERVRGRDRAARRDTAPVEWGRAAPAQLESPVAFDDSADLESFPVMARLTEVQRQIAALAGRVEQVGQLLERLDRVVAESALTRVGWRSAEEPFPQGVTARANPMTHPITPPSAPRSPDPGREEALASVRALFVRHRPWWQRLPNLLKG